MRLFPHKIEAHVQIPLKRAIESIDDLDMAKFKTIQLVTRLWQTSDYSAEVEMMFKKERVIIYNGHKGDRIYSAPFMHDFFLVTHDGLGLLQSRFMKKYGMDAQLIGQAKEFEALCAWFFSQAGSSFLPIIFYDHKQVNSHVTPCALIKNSKGVFFFHLDAVGGIAPGFCHDMLKSILPPMVEYFINVEKRQLDGFNCRTEAFLTLKTLFQFFKQKPELTPDDVFARIDPSCRMENDYRVYLKGAFLATSQYLIKDPRSQELVFGKTYSLQNLQMLFAQTYFLSLAVSDKPSLESTSSSVYLQCKTLKYILEYEKEMAAIKAAVEASHVFSMTEEF